MNAAYIRRPDGPPAYPEMTHKGRLRSLDRGPLRMAGIGALPPPAARLKPSRSVPSLE
jgi:hypothetical protein